MTGHGSIWCGLAYSAAMQVGTLTLLGLLSSEVNLGTVGWFWGVFQSLAAAPWCARLARQGNGRAAMGLAAGSVAGLALSGLAWMMYDFLNHIPC